MTNENARRHERIELLRKLMEKYDYEEERTIARKLLPLLEPRPSDVGCRNGDCDTCGVRSCHVDEVP
jgi:hypothetical protein